MSGYLQGKAPVAGAQAEDPDARYLHHGGFVNHQLRDFLSASDPETRHRHAEVVRQLSPPNPQARGIADPAKQTQYEKWWYATREKIIGQLESGDAPGNSPHRSPGVSGEIRICERCHGSLPRDRDNSNSNSRGGSQSQQRGGSVPQQQQQQQQVAGAGQPPAPGQSSMSRSPNASMVSAGGSQQRSPSRSAMPGTDFEPLHPSHLYLHHGDTVNHYHEDLLRNPNNTEGLKLLEKEIARSPPRGPPGNPYGGLSEYEKWWYQERDRLAGYLRSHSAARSQ